MKRNPPKWADRFLRWYCNPDIIEEVQGDLYEIFDRELDSERTHFASWHFAWNVIRFFRWSNIRRSKTQHKMNQLGMFNNYFRVGIRNMSKQWGIATINILGLSFAVGLAVTTFLFIDMQLNMDNFHTNRANIYQIVNRVGDGQETSLWGDTPLLMGPQVLQDQAAVKNMVRFEYQYGNMRHGKDVFSEFVCFTDPSYFEIFDFKMKYGNGSALHEKSNIVISENLAIKYFGDEDPIGQQVSIKYGNGKIQQYVIGAVQEKFPENAGVSYGLLVPMSNFFDLDLEETYDWSYFADATFVELADGTDPLVLNDAFDSYIEAHNESDSRWSILDMELICLDGLALRGFDIVGSVAEASHPAGRIALGALSGILMLLACFNYMNISIASATRRLKEIAMRKVMGGNRSQIIMQFLFENLIQVFIALLVGVAISYFFLLPGFNAMIPITIPFEFSSLPTLIFFFAGLLLVIGLVSGGYPALYISSFQPTSIFKGNQKFGSKNLFSRILLGFQFFFSFSTIVGSLVFVENSKYLAEKDWGYEPGGLISIPLNDTREFIALRDAAAENSEVISTAGARGHIGRKQDYTNIERLGEKMGTFLYDVGEGYLETMNLRLKEGRFFLDNESDRQNSIIVNEAFVEKMGWDQALGQFITYDSSRLTVVGVVADFHYEQFYHPIEPVMFRLVDEEVFDYFVAKAEPDRLADLDELFQATWAGVSPNDPYHSLLQADAFDLFFVENRANVIIISTIAVIAVILTALGLFGLFAFNIRKKLKEFSVRKVLGARPWHIVKIAGKEYIWVVLISMFLGAPAGYYLISQLIISIYPEPKEPGVLPLIAAVLIVLATVGITIIGQIRRATGVNPSEILRSE